MDKIVNWVGSDLILHDICIKLAILAPIKTSIVILSYQIFMNFL
jgi:hypothetical protein